MKKQLYLLTLLIIDTSMILVACGGAAPTQSPAGTQPPEATQAPTLVPPGSVAILVIDDFDDELANVDNTLAHYKEILKTKDFNVDEISTDINPSKNCIYTVQGQAAVVSKGAAAVVSKGADGSPITLPAPHGDVTFEELHSVINRALDSNGQQANNEIAVTNGLSEFPNDFGRDWIKTIIYFTNNESNLSIALYGVDTSYYTTDTIAEHLGYAIEVLRDKGYSQFVVNMSFVMMPCHDFAQSQSTFDEYQKLLNEDPQLAYLKDYLTSLTEENGNVSFIDRDGNIILKKLAVPDENGNYFTDRNDNSINDQDAGLILALDPALGPLHLRSYYNIPDYFSDPGNFLETYHQVLNDPLRAKLVERSTAFPVIPVAAAGNDGLPYPYAPAMWNEVLSVSGPTDGQDENNLQLSNFIDEAGNALQFKSNSGEVVVEGCTEYKDTSGTPHRIPGTSFSAPKVSYLAALYLLQGGSVSCTGNLGVSPVPPLGYASEDGNWQNMTIPDAAGQYCSVFPASVDIGTSCP